MAKQQTNNLQTKGTIYASGTIATGSTASLYKTLTEQLNSGITKTNASTYTVVTPGVYFMRFQQLIQTSGAVNFMLRINNVETRRAWQNSSDMNDMVVADVRFLNAGDTIRLFQSAAIAHSWAGVHSGYQIIMLRGA